MMQVQIDAIKRIRDDTGKGSEPRREFMRPFIADIICKFCEQSPEFAQKVLDDKNGLTGCLASLKFQQHYLSDLDAYTQAARYFFPEAIVECTMTIRSPKKQTSAKILDLDLTDLLGV